MLTLLVQTTLTPGHCIVTDTIFGEDSDEIAQVIFNFVPIDFSESINQDLQQQMSLFSVLPITKK